MGSGSGVGAAKRAGELVTRADVELHVTLGQVALDGSQGDEQRLGDLAVAEAVGSEPSDSTLAGRQRVKAAAGSLAGPRAARESSSRAVGPCRGAASVSEVERFAQRFTRLAAISGAA